MLRCSLHSAIAAGFRRLRRCRIQYVGSVELANSISCECWWLLHFGEACTALAVFAMLSLQHYSKLV
jgi:hypothetical protein